MVHLLAQILTCAADKIVGWAHSPKILYQFVQKISAV